jgi:hypothetical protein
MGNFREVFDESMVESCMAWITTNSLDIGWRWKLFNNLYLSSIHLYPSFRHPVSENDPFCYHEMAFFLVEDKILLGTPSKNFIKIFKALREGLSINREIVHENFYDLLDHIREDWHHAMLKRGWSII